MPESDELKQLLDIINFKKEKLTAMLAPSFPIDFAYPGIIGRLKKAGFSYVVEVARGALETNNQVIAELKKDPQKRVITSPCPSCVGYIKSQRPQLINFLSQADSPMTATAKLVLKMFPNTRPVFIGPCLTKKIEAKNYPDLDILALTYKELDQFFKKINLTDKTENLKGSFDLLGPQTRLYPISGGLCQSAGINEFLTKEEYWMVSGLANLNSALDEFIKNKNMRLLDILFCEGGCINGPGIMDQQPLKSKRHKIVKYWSTHLILT